MLIKPNAGQPANIKVVGVGGGGGNAINTMILEEDIVGVEFIAMNTDAQALLNHKADIKIQIGENITKGLGSGGSPEVGRQAAEESREKIKQQLDGADMVFIAAGEGGGTGTGASPIVAEISKELGALTVAVVTRPFGFEGSRRKVAADDGVESLRNNVDTLIVIPNQKVLEIIDSKVSVVDAFKKVDSVLHQGVKGIAELITTPGLVNVDFADVKSIMQDAGTALMGIGTASGENRTTAAVKHAISSPLLETSISGARGVLFNVIGGKDLSMAEVDEAASIIAKTVDPDADIIFGAVIDEKMVDEVRVTVIASRIDESKFRIARMHHDPMPAARKDDEEKTVQTSPKENPMRRDTDDELIGETDEFDVPTFLRRKR
jgi:cell division protein FtsZ